MQWFCEICDNIMIEEIRNKHLESNFHDSLVTSFMRENILSSPLSDKIEDTIRKT